jgi:hypothetical protein
MEVVHAVLWMTVIVIKKENVRGGRTKSQVQLAKRMTIRVLCRTVQN